MSSRAVQVRSATVPVAPRSCTVVQRMVLVVSSMGTVSRALVPIRIIVGGDWVGVCGAASSHGGSHLRTDSSDLLDACNGLRIGGTASRCVRDRLFVVANGGARVSRASISRGDRLTSGSSEPRDGSIDLRVGSVSASNGARRRSLWWQPSMHSVLSSARSNQARPCRRHTRVFANRR
jgi:hypothetical protein